MFITDLLFPKFCIVCKYVGSYFCIKCQKSLKVLNRDNCIYCKKPSFYGFTHNRCQRINCLDGVTSIYIYNYQLQKIIKSIKYRRSTEVWKEFESIVKLEAQNKLQNLQSIMNFDFVCAIPLSSAKMKARGFNQSFYIRDMIGTVLDTKIQEVLVRKKNTFSQTELESIKMRFKNMTNAFTLEKNTNIHNKRIILVDDVVTSGATLRSASTVLKSCGASFVYAVTLAKGR